MHICRCSTLKPVSGGGVSACFGDTVLPAVPLSIVAFAFIGIWGDAGWKKKVKAGKKSISKKFNGVSRDWLHSEEASSF
jgi:hypothetical protein